MQKDFQLLVNHVPAPKIDPDPAFRMLVTTLEADARARGFRYMYLETLHSMVEAGRLYQKMAFDPLPGPMGNTGHSGCGLFYGKVL